MTGAEIGAVPAAAPQTDTQNLFEHAALHAQGLSEGAGPAQLGGEVLQSLQGYAERSGTLAERAGQRTGEVPPPELVSASGAPVPPAPDPAREVSGPQMDRAIESLGLMFDHAIETQLVVRGATQVSGAANTLLRGQ
ncbi:hypothetical protein [Falsirhodobacter halotolerans]|uniref:hypothetical protein n=1 Tax=Falsirhodobacter halotolerans TaxID=1146892 RepID=UPI001FD0B85D|nr:hypothetical protein [Falsirhodobacter halotolerans]MCJ8141072.1 hypothetical protein [Falsirhodobacter halotolerans]